MAKRFEIEDLFIPMKPLSFDERWKLGLSYLDFLIDEGEGLGAIEFWRKMRRGCDTRIVEHEDDPEV